MFFNIFRMKKSKNDISIDNCKTDDEVILDKNIEDLSFESKMIYVLDDKIVPFPKKCNKSGNIFEKEKFLSVAEEIYKSSFAKEIIEKIEIRNLKGDAGHCNLEIKNNKLCITIKIESFKLGLVTSGYINEYSSERCIEFRNILAHELVHAEDHKRIVDAFGVKEYQEIRNNEIAKLGCTVLSEYSACRKTAEQYRAFDSNEDINKIIKSQYSLLGSDNISEYKFENPGNRELDYAKRLNYAIATRCAFADVLQEKEADLKIPSDNKINKEYTKYIMTIRNLLRVNFDNQPLNVEKYKKLGHEILNGLSEIYSVRNNVI